MFKLIVDSAVTDPSVDLITEEQALAFIDACDGAGYLRVEFKRGELHSINHEPDDTSYDLHYSVVRVN
ncbi:MAG: hypothetical protein EHM43_00110 [Ignavibacteriae bacterium]|nr:MAG: hypothetical protein EHM43_00110 [Ignavibacteriota bacterium]